jgi:hypothetical protein
LDYGKKNIGITSVQSQESRKRHLAFTLPTYSHFKLVASVPVPRLRVDVRVFIMYSQYNWNITLFGSCELDCTCIARLETRSMYYGYQLLVGFNLALYVIHLLCYKCRYKLAKIIYNHIYYISLLYLYSWRYGDLSGRV